MALILKTLSSELINRHNMNVFKHIISGILMLVLCFSLFCCGLGKQSEIKNSLNIEEVYYSLLDSVNREIVIISKSQDVPLDHVYFQGKKIHLTQQNNTMFSGRYQIEKLKKKDVIMSDKPFAEYGNIPPKLPEKIPFSLKENECMIGYKKGNEWQYFKYSKVILK